MFDWIYIILALQLICSIALLRTMFSGSWCWVGLHRDYIFYDRSQINWLGNYIDLRGFEVSCAMCLRTKTIQPGSRKWKAHSRNIQQRLDLPDYRARRGCILLEEGFEVDLVSGEIVEHCEH